MSPRAIYTLIICAVLTLGAAEGAATDPSDNQTLFGAVRTGDGDLVSTLLAQGIDPDVRDDRELTPLIVATNIGNIVAVKILVEAGADVEAKNVDGQNALMYASQNGYIEIVTFLLEHGVGIDISANDASTALFFAAAFGHPEIVKITTVINFPDSVHPEDQHSYIRRPCVRDIWATSMEFTTFTHSRIVKCRTF